jgi:hypothetical protein
VRCAESKEFSMFCFPNIFILRPRTYDL